MSRTINQPLNYLFVIGLVVFGWVSVTQAQETPDVIDTDTPVATAEEGVTSNESTLAATTSVSEGVIPVDSYRREALPSDEVFGDFVVGPGRFEVQVAPGEAVTVELVISNRMGDGRLFSFDIEDATGSDSGDEAISLLGDAEGPYSLRDFIEVPQDRFYLEHATRVRIPVTIALPPDAEPGGRYGSLLTTVTSLPSEAEVAAGARPAAAVVSRIGTLFFVTTPGDIERVSELQSFGTRSNQTFYSAGPVVFDTLIENLGSVHTTPSATLRITNLLGEEVGFVEIDPWFVMPQSLRNREVTWDRELLFGRYEATLDLDFGHDDLTTTASTVFWVIPLTFVAIVFFSFLALFLLFRFVFSRFEFKRKS